jgi:GGDEF domain-containing protein
MAVVVLKVDVVDLTTFSVDGWQKRALDAAQRAAKVIREVDISASLSPYEFAICLIHCDREGAYKALERMLTQLPDYNCEAGVAVYPEEGYEPSALVEVAGARLKQLRIEASA